MAYAVWEWQSDTAYLPYSSEVSHALENAKAGALNELPLGTVDPYLEPFKVNIPQLVQITLYNGRSRKIRRQDVSSNHPLSKGMKWEWNFHSDTWFPYGTLESGELQSRQESNAVQFTLSSLPTYRIDLQAMVQINMQTQFQRKIRKVSCTPYTCPVGGSSVPLAQMRAPPPAQMRAPAHASTRANAVPAASTQNPPNSFMKRGRVVTPGAGTGAGGGAGTGAGGGTGAGAGAGGGANSQIPSTSAAGSGRGIGVGAPLNAAANLQGSLQGVLQQSCKAYKAGAGPPDLCPVCKNKITDSSDYDTGPALPGISQPRLTLTCQHHIHNQCLYAMIESTGETSSFRCPECQRSYGTRTGNQPINGKMSVKVDNSMNLVGYEQYATIIITYNFTSGVLENGQSFTASNFPRTAYIPDTDKGNDIVDLLKLAFKRRLVFTVGTSVTTGQPNCVVWNDIHHKTSMRRGDAHGYPDPGYLDRVIAELKSKGVE